MSGPETDWEATLDRLEADVRRVELALDAGEVTAPAASWTPPRHSRPLPPSLVGRAEHILARQQRAQTALAGAASVIAQQQKLDGHLRDAVAEPRPVYVDVRA